jgi:AraC family transcriptional regulator of adaptative response / DNA-3-methyladenine glycosylase II
MLTVDVRSPSPWTGRVGRLSGEGTAVAGTRESNPAPRGIVRPVLDADTCYAAVRGRDPRFDGLFVTAVDTTRIYCRPSCPARTPLRRNVRFLPSPASAHAAGFRACKRCRPDAAPGSPDWDVRADVVGRAMRLVDDGVVDRDGIDGLASRLGYSTRQLRRLIGEELGAGPLALARARRAQTARTLLETTDLPVVEVAFAAGFGSMRQCNDTIREVYAATPKALRTQSVGAAHPKAGALTLRLAYREPCDVPALLTFLGAHAIAGVEDWDGTRYRRSLRLPRGEAIVALAAGEGHVEATLWLADLRDLTPAVARLRHLLDLDADPRAVGEVLHGSVLAPLIARFPGGRVAGSVDGAEIAVRTLLGQQVSLAAARLLGARLVAAAGTPLAAPAGAITHLFPSPAAVAALDPTTLAMPRARGRALVGLAAALDGGLDLGPDADRGVAEAALLALPGIGPWTARYARMRALADPDVLLVEDLAVRRVAASLGLPADPRGLAAVGAPWRPWRSYATALLWAQALSEMRPA